MQFKIVNSFAGIASIGLSLLTLVNGVYIRCGEGDLGGIPFSIITLDQPCDYFQNTAGPCTGHTYANPAGPLKGPGACDGAKFWYSGGNWNVLLKDGSHHYCGPDWNTGGNPCTAG